MNDVSTLDGIYEEKSSLPFMH